MRKTLACLAVITVMGSVPLLAESWKGRISDGMCNAKHADGEHGTKKMTDRACVESCVKGGSKYVFVDEKDKAYAVANQKFAGLKTHAGHEVIVTGTMKDDVVTITKIEMPKPDTK